MKGRFLLVLFILLFAAVLNAADEGKILNASSLTLNLVLDSSANNYEIGFCDRDGNPINATTLRVNPDTGTISDDGNIYIYWNIISVSPFDISLNFANDGNLKDLKPSVSVVGGSTSESIEPEQNKVYSQEIRRPLDISTGVSAEDAEIKAYSGSLILKITA